MTRRAGVVGTGLIGASIGLALRSLGWRVTGDDVDAGRARLARELGALDAVGTDGAAEVTFVATPVRAVAAAARAALAAGDGLVTDVGSVKAPIVAAVGDPRFVGGHPMAGSEQEGPEGADPAMFDGAVWVLTPDEATQVPAYAELRAILSSFGAEVVALPPADHDTLVAVVSHVPHLTAATLMRLAVEASTEHAALLRLAAGGFRDMTRVAAGHPGIWPDICAENRDAIVGALDRLVAGIGHMRDLVARGDREGLLTTLEAARAARVNLPAGLPPAGDLAELRVPVPDRVGVLAEVTTTASALGVSILDLEIAHSAEGQAGVIILVVDAGSVDGLREALAGRGFHTSAQPLASRP